jgi:hypothetical protein
MASDLKKVLLSLGIGAAAGFAASYFGLQYAETIKDSSALAYIACEDPTTTKIAATVAGGLAGAGIYGLSCLTDYIFNYFSKGKSKQIKK